MKKIYLFLFLGVILFSTNLNASCTNNHNVLFTITFSAAYKIIPGGWCPNGGWTFPVDSCNDAVIPSKTVTFYSDGTTSTSGPNYQPPYEYCAACNCDKSVVYWWYSTGLPYNYYTYYGISNQPGAWSIDPSLVQFYSNQQDLDCSQLGPTNGPDCGGDGGDGSSGGSCGCKRGALPIDVGFPVNIATGNMYHEETDFNFSDVLFLKRTYNSYGDTNNNPTGYLPRFGSKWSFNFGVNLAVIPGGKRILSPSGKWRRYRGSDSTGYSARPGTKGSLTYTGSEYIETLNTGTKNYFDNQGRLIETVLATGQSITLDYNQPNYINVADEFGRTISLLLNSNGNVDQVTDPTGRAYNYYYTGNVLTSVKFPDGSIKNYGYQSPDLLTSITVNGLSLAQWNYDSNGYCISSSTDGVNNSVTLSYNTSTATTTVTDSRNSISTYTYQHVNDGIIKTTNVTGNCGCTGSSASYGSSGNIITKTDKRGDQTKYYNYDAKFNPGRIDECDNSGNVKRTTRYTYHPITSEPTSITRKSAIPFGSYSTFTRNYAYDSNNRLIKSYKKGNTRDINGNLKFVNYSTSYSYDSHSRIRTASDPLGHRVVFDYYSTASGDPGHGQLKSVTNALGATYTLGDYSSGKAGWMQTPTGETVNYTYDARGRLLSAVSSNSSGTISKTTRYSYDAVGNVTSILLPAGSQIGYQYDSANRPIKAVDSNGNYISYAYDTEGNRTVMEAYDPSGTLKYHQGAAYDSNSRLTSLISSSNVTQYILGYDGNGNVTSKTDYKNNAMTYTYDALDRLVQFTLPDAGDGLGTINAFYTSDINDNAVTTTDGDNNTTTDVYDDFGRPIQTTSAEGKTTRYEYDAADNLIKIKDPKGNETDFTYTYNINQLTVTKTYANGGAVTYTFSGAGLLVSKQNSRGTTANYTYDEFGRLLSISYTDGTQGYAKVYDPAYDRITSRTDASGTSSYTYDANADISSVTDPWGNMVNYTYDALGRISTIQVGSGEVIQYVYDNDGRLGTVQAGTRAFTYSYSSASEDPSKLTRPNGSVTNYTYDNIFRLKDIGNKKADGTTVITENAFVYDKAHMRTQETVTNGNLFNAPAKSVSYSYNNLNQLTNAGFAYDADGNMTSFITTPEGYAATAIYDVENRLTTVTYRDSQGVQHSYSFTYNSDDMLAKQVIDGVETRFVRDLNFNVLQERDGSNNLVRSYVWNPTEPGGIGGLLEMTQNGQHYYYLYDGKGNVSAVIDSNQNVIAAYKYDGFGKLLSKTGMLDQPYQFSTKPCYSSLGLVYYGYRFGNTLIGKWITRDPLEEKGGENLYEYALNNSVNFADFFGLVGEIFSNINTATNYKGAGGGLGELPGLTNERLLTIGISSATVVGGGVLIWPGIEGAYYLTMARISAWPGSLLVSELLHSESGGLGRRTSDAMRDSNNLCEEAIEGHHLLPIKYRDYFAKAGFDIDDYILPLEKGAHRLRNGNGVHTLNNALGKKWEDMWKPFIERYPNPTPADQKKILDYMNKLRRQYGI